MSQPTRSMFATEIECLRARDKWYANKIEELERELAEVIRDRARFEVMFVSVNEDLSDVEQELVALKASPNTDELMRVAEGIRIRKETRGFYMPEDAKDLMDELAKWEGK